MKKILFLLLLFPIAAITFAGVNLDITGSVIPITMYRGDTYTVTFYVKNTGTTSTATSFYINVSVSGVDHYDGSQTYLTDILVTGGINAGDTKTCTKEITIPCLYSTGTKFVLASADVTFAIAETSESDNTESQSIVIKTLADFIPFNTSLSSTTVNAGNSITAYFAVNNLGGSSGGSSIVGIYLSNSPTLIIADATLLATYSVGSVSGCSCSVTFNQSVTIPSTTCTGTKYLHIWVDKNEAVTESFDNNNFKYFELNITGTAPSQPPTPTSDSPACGSVTLTRAGSPPAGVVWYWQGTSCGTSTTFSGSTYTALTSGTYYLRAKNTTCGTWSTCSNVTVTVNSSSSPATSISATSSTIVEGESTTLSWSGGSLGTGANWKLYSGSCGGTLVYSGTGTSKTVFPTTTTTYYLRAEGTCNTTTCLIKTITVTPACDPITLISTTPDRSVIEPSSTTFTIAVAGTSPTYQWEYSINAGASWSNVPNTTPYSGVTTSTLTINPTSVAMNGNKYRCKIGGPCTTTWYGNWATLTVNSLVVTPTIINIFADAHNIDAGENITLSSSVTGSPTSYNWTIKGGTPYSTLTATGPNPTVALNRPGSYKVTLIASNGAGSSAPYTTITNFITVKPTTLTLAKPPKNAVIHNQYTSLIGDPVNTGTGSFEYSHSDLKFSGLLNNVEFVRYYSTVNKDTDGPLGFGWSHSYNFYIQDQDSLWIVHHGDGHFSYYVPVFNGLGSSFPLYGGINEILLKDELTGLFTLTLKTGEIYQFDGNNNIASITDIFGNSTTFNYTDNLLVSISDPGGRYFNFSYSGGKLIEIIDPINRIIQFEYDAFGNLSSVINAKGGHTNFNYAEHQIISVIDPRGNPALTNIYENGLITSQKDALNQETTFTYDTIMPFIKTTIEWPDASIKSLTHDTLYRLVEETDELGYIKSYVYNYNNDRISSTDENGYVTLFNYDTLGNTTSVTTPDGNTTTIDYYIYSKPKRITTPVGDSINFTYSPDISNFNSFKISEFGRENNVYFNEFGQVTSFTDNNPIAIIDSFNTFGDLTQFADAVGERYHNIEYDGVGRPIRFIDGLEHQTEFRYSASDKLTAIIDHNGDSISYAYDQNDNLVSVTDKKGFSTTYKYDKKNRLDSIVNCNLIAKTLEYDVRDNIIITKDEENRTIGYDYDPRNLLSTITNSLGSTTISYEPARHLSTVTIPSGGEYTIEYDLLYNKIAIVDPEMNRTEYAYNDLNEITEIKDALGNTTTYQYFRTGEIQNIIDAMDNITSYTYDAWGRLSSITDANSHTQTFDEYDEYNLLTKKTDASGKIYNYEYDKAGNLISESTYWGTVTRSYDPLNRLSIMHVGDDTYQYEYDPNGNITQIISLTGIENYTFTNLNQIAIHTDVYGNSTSNIYDNVGNRIYIQYSGGLGIHYNYNDANLLSSVVDWNNDTTSYSYNSDGQVTDMVYPNGISCNYSYDGAGRMVEKFISLDSSIYFHSILALDPVGNIISEERTGPIPSHISGYKPRIYHSPPFPEASYYNDTISYTYSNNNKLLTAEDFSWSESAMSEYESWPGTSNYYRYREDGLLIDYRKSMDILLEADTKYTYDGFRNRIKTTFGADQKRFVIDNNSGLAQVLEEHDETGDVKFQYIYGLGLIGRIDSAGQILYYLSDASHNIFALSNDSAQITDTYIYDPFGTVFEHDGPTFQPYTFLGEFGVQQEDSLFYYVRERFYHSGMGRFLTPDPYPVDLMNPQTLNEYVYGFNNPIVNFDPTGLFAWNSYGISILQMSSALGSLAQIGVMLYFEDYNPISIGEHLNDFSKNFVASYSNFNNAINGNHNWVTSDQFTGIREKYINNSTYSEIVKINNLLTLIGGNTSFVSNLKDIPIALKYYPTLNHFAGSSLLISGGKSILYLNDFFNTAQSFKNCK